MLKYLKHLTWKQYLFFIFFFIIVNTPPIMALNRALEQQKDLENLATAFDQLETAMFMFDLNHNYQECQQEF